MTEAELIQISRDFKKMIDAIPKTRVREHLPTINQISRLLGQLRNEMYQTPRPPDAWQRVIGGKN
jgi:hypothetical protein